LPLLIAPGMWNGYCFDPILLTSVDFLEQARKTPYKPALARALEAFRTRERVFGNTIPGKADLCGRIWNGPR
jgi:hypothetical protein